jgi:hypothetical protein
VNEIIESTSPYTRHTGKNNVRTVLTEQKDTSFYPPASLETASPLTGADMQQREKWRWRICAYRDFLFGKSHFIIFTT